MAGDRQSVGRSPAILSLIHDHRQSDLSLPRCLAVMGKPTVLLKATGHSTLRVTGRYKDSHCRCKLPGENSNFFFLSDLTFFLILSWPFLFHICCFNLFSFFHSFHSLISFISPIPFSFILKPYHTVFIVFWLFKLLTS